MLFFKSLNCTQSEEDNKLADDGISLLYRQYSIIHANINWIALGYIGLIVHWYLSMRKFSAERVPHELKTATKLSGTDSKADWFFQGEQFNELQKWSVYGLSRQLVV